jgi:hypothetical protein
MAAATAGVGVVIVLTGTLTAHAQPT